MKIGLFFGSFNPIHIGHTVIANYVAEFTDLEQIWLVVSPHNPFKIKSSLADGRERLSCVKKAIRNHNKIKVCDVEFSLPQPSYTIHTLELLTKKYPRYQFVLIIGSDNLKALHTWKVYKKILSGYKIFVYPRFGFAAGKLKGHRNVKILNAPRLDISSTFIREQLRKGKDMQFFVA